MEADRLRKRKLAAQFFKLQQLKKLQELKALSHRFNCRPIFRRKGSKPGRIQVKNDRFVDYLANDMSLPDFKRSGPSNIEKYLGWLKAVRRDSPLEFKRRIRVEPKTFDFLVAKMSEPYGSVGSLQPHPRSFRPDTITAEAAVAIGLQRLGLRSACSTQSLIVSIRFQRCLAQCQGFRRNLSSSYCKNH
jgi:hypothetical protein